MKFRKRVKTAGDLYLPIDIPSGSKIIGKCNENLTYGAKHFPTRWSVICRYRYLLR